MKKYRSIAAVLAVILVVVAVLAGIHFLKPTAISITKKVIKNLDKVESFTGDINVEYEGPISVSGLDFDLVLKADSTMENAVKAGVSHTSGTIGTKLPIIGDIDIPIESYQKVENDEAVTYMSMDGTHWHKMKKASSDQESSQGSSEEAEEAGTGTDTEFKPDYKTILGIMKKINDGELSATLAEETEMIGEKEVYRIDVLVTGDLIAELLKAANEASGEGASLPEDMTLTGGDVKMIFYVYKNEMLPAGMVLDGTALGSVLMQKMNKGQDITVDTKKCIITISNLDYNKVNDLQIPESVITSAVEGEFNLFEGAMGL